ncbi:MAG: SurA N-terminal domain-containing protein [Thermomicrobiales bacterium]
MPESDGFPAPKREAKRQKQLRWGVGLAAVAVLAVLLGFATWDYIVKPRQVLATVDGTRIRREDYWKFRRLELYQQMSQYSQYSQLVSDQSQAQQYQSLALQAQAQFDTVWGSTDVNDSTLQQMIDNQIYVDGLEDFGLTITDEELERWTLNQFAPAEMPLIEPTVTPTYVPERAQWATETAEALIPTTEISPTVTAGASTPIGGATPVTQASPITDMGTDASPVASPEATDPRAHRPRRARWHSKSGRFANRLARSVARGDDGTDADADKRSGARHG